mgnify:CR=1 FL=1
MVVCHSRWLFPLFCEWRTNILNDNWKWTMVTDIRKGICQTSRELFGFERRVYSWSPARLNRLPHHPIWLSQPICETDNLEWGLLEVTTVLLERAIHYECQHWWWGRWDLRYIHCTTPIVPRPRFWTVESTQLLHYKNSRSQRLLPY